MEKLLGPAKTGCIAPPEYLVAPLQVAGKLLCSGHKDDDSVIDVIDPENWTLVKRIDLPRNGWKNTLSREGMTFNGNLYFLPDDGPDSHIMIFTFN